jgi:hypothetical protein
LERDAARGGHGAAGGGLHRLSAGDDDDDDESIFKSSAILRMLKAWIAGAACFSEHGQGPHFFYSLLRTPIAVHK